jgi:glutamine amidotransferase
MPSPVVAIIDSGGANIASLVFALNRLSVASHLTSRSEEIVNATHVILPGVGAAENAMQRLRESGIDKMIPQLTQPVLGICLGMQLLADSSDEDSANCLGIIPGHASKLPAQPDYPVPNMGWCRVSVNKENSLLHGIEQDAWFYFIHSYALPELDYTIATAEHTEKFSAVLNRDNFYATQFHPERSAECGQQLLKNFVDLST